ncbi:MAG: winged helix-turn-helix transcriptional regulator [Candidatus Thorarchaeota archaeon]
MDQIDKTIIQELRENCRVSFETLARQCGITANAVKRRVNKLVELGVIEKFVINLSLEMMNGQYLICNIVTDGTEDETEFIDLVGSYPMVTHSFYDSLGICVLFAEVPGVKGLSDLGSYLRSLEHAVEVNLHVLPRERGGTIDLTVTHLKVLQVLRNDPRATISTLAKKTGMTARRVRRIVNQFIESQAVRFTIHLTLNAGGATMFVIRLTWDEKQSNEDEIIEWFKKEYRQEYWYHYTSASDPLIWVILVVDHMREAENIVRSLKQVPSVNPTHMVFPYPEKRFKGLGNVMLDELLETLDG